MNGLLALILREGLNQFAGGRAAQRSIRYGIDAIILYGVLGTLGVAALIFFYIALFLLLEKSVEPEWAAAILCGATLLLIGLVFVIHAIVVAKRAPSASALGNGKEIEMALALGQKLHKDFQKAAPQMAVVAAVVGLVVGLRPELLDILTGGGKRKPKN